MQCSTAATSATRRYQPFTNPVPPSPPSKAYSVHHRVPDNYRMRESEHCTVLAASVQERLLIQTLTTLQRMYFKPINPTGRKKYKTKLETLKSRAGSSKIATILTQCHKDILRGYDPIIILHNTGATLSQARSLVDGRTHGNAFPITIERLDSLNDDYVAQALYMYTVQRSQPYVTIQVCLTASELLDWIENEKISPKCKHNFQEIHPASIRGLLVKGYLRGSTQLLIPPSRNTDRHLFSLLKEALRNQGLPEDLLMEAKGVPLEELCRDHSIRRLPWAFYPHQEDLFEWATGIRQDWDNTYQIIVSLWAKLILLRLKPEEIKAPSLCKSKIEEKIKEIPLPFPDKLMERLEEKIHEEIQSIKRADFLLPWRRENEGISLSPEGEDLIDQLRIITHENSEAFYALRKYLEKRELCVKKSPHIVKKTDEVLWQHLKIKSAKSPHVLLEILTFLAGLDDEDRILEGIIFFRSTCQSWIDRHDNELNNIIRFIIEKGKQKHPQLMQRPSLKEFVAALKFVD